MARPFGPFLRWLQRSDVHVDEFWERMLGSFQGKPFPSLQSSEHRPRDRSALEPPQTISEFSIESKFRLALAITLILATNIQEVSFCTVVSGRGTPVRGITEITYLTPTVMPVRGSS